MIIFFIYAKFTAKFSCEYAAYVSIFNELITIWGDKLISDYFKVSNTN